MTALFAILVGGIAVLLAAAMLWDWIVAKSYQRNPPCHPMCEQRGCLRLRGHLGAHLDDVGRTWPR